MSYKYLMMYGTILEDWVYFKRFITGNVSQVQNKCIFNVWATWISRIFGDQVVLSKKLL